MKVSVAKFEESPREYLRLVKSGEVVTLTEKGKAVATLSAVKKETREERWRRLEDEGFVTRPSGRGFAKVTPLKLKGGELASSWIIEDRGPR